MGHRHLTTYFERLRHGAKQVTNLEFIGAELIEDVIVHIFDGHIFDGLCLADRNRRGTGASRCNGNVKHHVCRRRRKRAGRMLENATLRGKKKPMEKNISKISLDGVIEKSTKKTVAQTQGDFFSWRTVSRKIRGEKNVAISKEKLDTYRFVRDFQGEKKKFHRNLVIGTRECRTWARSEIREGDAGDTHPTKTPRRSRNVTEQTVQDCLSHLILFQRKGTHNVTEQQPGPSEAVTVESGRPCRWCT